MEVDFQTAEIHFVRLQEFSRRRPGDVAIEIARRAGLPLWLAGPIEPQYLEFFDSEVLPHVDGARVVFFDALDQKQLMGLYRQAAAVIMPLRWDEPFGLVAVEAMACGTPVVGTNRGALPEIIETGVTGFVFEGIDEAVAALANIGEIDRAVVRKSAETRFSRRIMASRYEEVYRAVLGARNQALDFEVKKADR